MLHQQPVMVSLETMSCLKTVLTLNPTWVITDHLRDWESECLVVILFCDRESDDTRTDTQTDRQTDRQTQTDFIICPIAICYSYGADKN